MKQAMSYDKSVFTFGIAVDKTGHVFKSTEGILKNLNQKELIHLIVNKQKLHLLWEPH